MMFSVFKIDLDYEQVPTYVVLLSLFWTAQYEYIHLSIYLVTTSVCSLVAYEHICSPWFLINILLKSSQRLIKNEMCLHIESKIKNTLYNFIEIWRVCILNEIINPSFVEILCSERIIYCFIQHHFAESITHELKWSILLIKAYYFSQKLKPLLLQILPKILTVNSYFIK